MNVLDAIQSRKSIRAFRPDPVPLETVEKILRIAQRAPSGTNTQPWHVHVCAGAVKEAVSRDALAMIRAGEAKSYDELDYYPQTWHDIHRDRRRGVGWSLYGLLGIQKGDREAAAKQSARNFLFFDAPVGLFITTERYLLNGSWSDTGMYIQTIMLAAKGFGLDTCPQAAWIPVQEAVYRNLEIPEDQVLVSGMALGFADPDAIENTLVSDREALENVATFRGFD